MQDVSHDDIPIMLVGNKTDMRTQALQEGETCIPTSYGEKLAMVSSYSLFLFYLLYFNFVSIHLIQNIAEYSTPSSLNTDTDKMMLCKIRIKRLKCYSN